MNQALGVIRLVRGYLAGAAVPQLPRGCEAVRERPLARERLFDPAACLWFVLRVSGEQDADLEVAIDAFGADVVRSQRTRWFVLPVSAQCHRDRSTGGSLIGFVAHGEDRVVGESLPHPISVSSRPRRTGICGEEACDMRDNVSVLVAQRRTCVYLWTANEP